MKPVQATAVVVIKKKSGENHTHHLIKRDGYWTEVNKKERKNANTNND